MPKKPPPNPERDSVAREVDRLLRQLPGADPLLKGDDRATDRPAAGRVRRPPGWRPPTPPPTPPGPVTRDRLTTWGQVALGAGLGVALTGWPYAHACGFPLVGYLAVVMLVEIVAGWAAMSAWRYRMAVAHVAALVVAFWGIVLAAEQVLPRVGYAAAEASWGCGAEGESEPVPAVPPVPAAPPATTESVGGAVAPSEGPTVP